MTLHSSDLAIHARGLAKRFGAVQAVSRIDLDLAPGGAMGLLGMNGAGKSTTLSMLMGLRAPDAGQALVFGHPAGSPAARRWTGATPQATDLPDQVTPREILTYAAQRYGMAPAIDRLIADFGLGDLIDRRVAGFSGGQMRRVALALAFVGQPRLVFLDEPTAGLDSAAQDAFRVMARSYVAQGGALVLTSHHWDEIESICSSIAVIDRGETVLAGRIDAIRGRARITRLAFDLPPDLVPPFWLGASQNGARWQVETSDSDTVLRRMVAEALPFANLTLQPLELKDLIHHLRQGGTRP
ncbi:MAG: ABC transporter ATP-binding protein [Paracoccaceae bacterium]|nr:ABC transporter ATP-binding protein [Paracoccaceae bacterium]